MNDRVETIHYALVDLRTGNLVRQLESADAHGTSRVAALSARAGDLLGTGDDIDWPALFGRLGSKLERQEFQEIVLVSAGRVYVLERLRSRPNVGLAAVAMAGEGLGLVLAGVHGKRAELDLE